MSHINVRPPQFAASPYRDHHHWGGHGESQGAARDYIIHSALDGNAQAQFDRGMQLYDSVPGWTRFRLSLTPGRLKKNVPDALIESYKWFSLARQKQVEGFVKSWMGPLGRMIGKQGRKEAERRARLWLAEFGPNHRGGSFVDELRRNVTEQ